MSTIDDSNHWLDFNEGGAEISFEIPNGNYLCTPLATLLSQYMTNNSGIGATYTVSYTVGVGFRFDTDSQTNFSLLWKTGTHGSDNTDTHIGTRIGFDDSADDSGALYYIGNWPVQCAMHGDRYQMQWFMGLD